MAVPQWAKYLYLRKIRDVELRARSGDFYDLIMATGLLRHLLMEDAPLVHKANSDKRIKLAFEITPTKRPPDVGSKLRLHIAGIDPTGWTPGVFGRKRVKANELLGTYCMTVEGFEYTVRDILEVCAYALGGIHLHDPDEKESMILAFTESWNVLGEPGIARLVREIISVILAGLEPLTDALCKEYGIVRIDDFSEASTG